MSKALSEFLKGNNVVFCHINSNWARYDWYETVDYLKRMGIPFKKKQSDLTIEVNGYTLKFAYREEQIIGLRDVHVFDVYGYDYYQ